jgi:hypothetical protein
MTMDAKAMIDGYVREVVARLPRRQRNDVGFELRSLLDEELQGMAAGAGRAPDAAMAAALLTRFGAPQDVADRYRPAGFTIVRPADAPGFARLALGGVALQWLLTLPAVLFAPEVAGVDPLTRLGAWWTSWGLGAFWWPGFMVCGAIAAGWIAGRKGEERAWSPLRDLDRDRIDRRLLALGLVAWAAGAAVLIGLPWWAERLSVIGLPWWAERLSGPAAAALALDETFLRTRAPWLLPVWAGHFLVYAAVFVRGRWSRRTRGLEVAFGAAITALLVWFAVAGPIFVAGPADGLVKTILLGLVLVAVLAWAVALHHARGRIRSPDALADATGA